MQRTRLQRAADYITKNIHRSITIGELATHVGMSPWHFARVFKHNTGRTPNEHIMRQRIQCARCRLARGVAIASVAFACGFANQPHMTRNFKAYTGQTPAQYQRTSTPQGWL